MPEREEERGPQRVVNEFQMRKRTLPRWECPEAIYHVRAKVHPERPERLVAPALGEIVRRSLHHGDGSRYELHCYVLMPSHFHAILRPLRRNGGAIPLPEIMQSLKGATAHHINKLVGVTGAFWMAESYNRIIRCSDEYGETFDYIWRNPYAAGLVDDPDDWAWWWERGMGVP